jgi:hypothetical protein
MESDQCALKQKEKARFLVLIVEPVAGKHDLYFSYFSKKLGKRRFYFIGT